VRKRQARRRQQRGVPPSRQQPHDPENVSHRRRAKERAHQRKRRRRFNRQYLRGERAKPEVQRMGARQPEWVGRFTAHDAQYELPRILPPDRPAGRQPVQE
jgi:hypothetical protein